MHETYEPVIIPRVDADNHNTSNNRLSETVYQTEPPYNLPHMSICAVTVSNCL